MEYRKLNIYAYSIEWEICESLEMIESIKPYTKPYIKHDFGIYRILPNGKVGYILDIGEPISHLEGMKKDPRMQEVCIFTYYNTKETFTGNFIDAIYFIQKKWEQID